MDDIYTNMSCRLYGTPHCRLLNAESCSKCYVAKLHPEEQEMVREDIRLIADNIPADGLESLSNSETCCLCKGKRKRKASYYAHFTLVHLHPEAADWRFRKRDYQRDVSMTIPVQLPACGDCSRRVLFNALVPLFAGIIIAALGLVIVSLESIRALLVRGGRAIPFLVFLIFVFLGIMTEALLKSKFTRELERRTYVRHSRLPIIGEMIRRGWIDLSEDSEICYTFSKRPLKNGILTGPNRAELIKQIRSDDTFLPNPSTIGSAYPGDEVIPKAEAPNGSRNEGKDTGAQAGSGSDTGSRSDSHTDSHETPVPERPDPAVEAAEKAINDNAGAPTASESNAAADSESTNPAVSQAEEGIGSDAPDAGGIDMSDTGGSDLPDAIGIELPDAEDFLH